MKKGKFEAGRNTAKPAARSAAPKAPAQRTASAPARKPAPKRKSSGGRVWPIIVGVAALAVLIGGILFYNSYKDDGRVYPNVYAGGVNIGGMTEEEAMEALAPISRQYQDNDMVLTLTPSQPTGDPEKDETLTLTVTPAQSKVQVDLESAVKAAYEYGREGSIFDKAKARSEAENGEYRIDAADFLSVDEAWLRQAAEALVKEKNVPFRETVVTTKTETETVEADSGDEDGEDETAAPQTREVQYIVIDMGVSERTINAQSIFDKLMESYAAAEFKPKQTYTTKAPAPVDVEKLYAQYCTEPKDASYDQVTFEITDEVLGYGFDKETVTRQLAAAKEGEELLIKLDEIQPEVTKEFLQSKLFSDVLASVDTPHTNIKDRTTNLILACKAIDGKILLPGDTFSFNRTVGERTEAKGYRPATAYVTGGASKPEIGGGVCQVASSIYYACLLADLKVVERTPHMFAVTYVPMGMDTTIYWGSLDYKFQNNTPYPLRIDASVSGGEVHITLMGTEWKDYTVKMSYEVLETYPWETVDKVITDGSYRDGEVIDTPYTGYKVVTYMTKYDKNGNKISTQQVAVSHYNKRDKTIARVGRPDDTTEPTESTEPSTEKPTSETPTESTTEQTEPPTEQTEPPTEETQPPTEEPTDPPTDPEPEDPGEPEPGM